MSKIFIDAGHGGHDPGAIGGRSREKDNVLNVAKRLKVLLENQGHTVRMSRSTDVFLGLSERARLANAWGADYFVSLHDNAATSNVSGFESFIHNGSVQSKTVGFQNAIHAEIIKGIGIKDRGKKRANFAVLRQTRMPAVLIEYAFISNSNDESVLINEVEKLAQLTANGIVNYAGGVKMKNGWTKSNTNWTFVQNGKLKTGWLQDKNKWYYLNTSGIMQTGWVQVSGKWYFLDNSGAMQTGWQEISNKWYYFNLDGGMATGWKKVDSEWYFLDSDGAMQTGWHRINGKWYYMYPSGRMAADQQITIGKDGSMQ